MVAATRGVGENVRMTAILCKRLLGRRIDLRVAHPWAFPPLDLGRRLLMLPALPLRGTSPALHRLYVQRSRTMTTATATAKVHRKAPLATPTDLAADAARDISGALTAVLSDMFALDLKSKNFHWHVSGP